MADHAAPEPGQILHRNPATQAGFTMVPNAILTAARLSSGARLLYALLKMYAWQEGSAFPGQKKLAGDLGVSTRQVRTYQAELERAGLITVEQRGLRQTNRYWIEDIPTSFLSDRNSTSDQERNPTSGLDRNSTSDKEDSAVKKTQQKKRETPAPLATVDETPPYQSRRNGTSDQVAPGTPVNRRPDAPGKVPRPVETPCPADFALTDDLRAWAREQTPSLVPQLPTLTRLFVSYYTGGKGAGTLAVNWRGMWQTWMLRQVADYSGSAGGKPALTVVPGPEPRMLTRRSS